MNKRRTMLDLIVEATDVPQELIPGTPLIEIVGNSRVMVDNHCGILEYTCNCICIRVSFGCLKIWGNKLCVTRMRKKQLVVTGEICHVDLEGGRKSERG